jgi:hypothetical protein
MTTATSRIAIAKKIKFAPISKLRRFGPNHKCHPRCSLQKNQLGYGGKATIAAVTIPRGHLAAGNLKLAKTIEASAPRTNQRLIEVQTNAVRIGGSKRAMLAAPPAMTRKTKFLIGIVYVLLVLSSPNIVDEQL